MSYTERVTDANVFLFFNKHLLLCETLVSVTGKLKNAWQQFLVKDKEGR